MNSRLTADFDAERSRALTCSPTGSRVRLKQRVLTPASICSKTTRVNGSRSAKYSYVPSGASGAGRAPSCKGERALQRSAGREEDRADEERDRIGGVPHKARIARKRADEKARRADRKARAHPALASHAPT